MRTLSSSDGGQIIIDTLLPHEGGTGVTTAPAALVALDAIPAATINAFGGVAGLDANGDIPLDRLPIDKISVISLEGPLSILRGAVQTYRINNYDSFTNYVFSSVIGTVTRNEDLVTYTAPNNPSVAGFRINDRAFTITITDYGVDKPNLTSPTNGSTVYTTSYNLTSSAFAASGNITHVATDWQVSTTPDFSNLFINNVADTVNKLSFPANNMVRGTTYYARVRFKASNNSYSPWSDAKSFIIATAFLFDKIVSVNTQNINIKTAAIAAGWDQVRPLIASVTVNNVITLGSADTTTPALDTDSNFPLGSTLSLINNGYVVGAGGTGGTGGNGNDVIGYTGNSGGPALRAQYALSVTNNGTIGGGGGGGGGGACAYPMLQDAQPNGGGGGGGGAGNVIGAGGSGGGFGLNTFGSSGNNSALTTGGTGGSGGQLGSTVGGTGGGGGNLGTAGSAGVSTSGYTGPAAGGTGGLAGAAVIGNSNVTWNVTGTRLGAIT